MGLETIIYRTFQHFLYSDNWYALKTRWCVESLVSPAIRHNCTNCIRTAVNLNLSPALIVKLQSHRLFLSTSTETQLAGTDF